MYLLDANVFIEAHRRYYAFDLCPGFWDWIDAARQDGAVRSIATAPATSASGKVSPLATMAVRRPLRNPTVVPGWVAMAAAVA